MKPLPLQAVQVVSGLEASDGGPSYSVPRLCEALRQAGIGAHVFTDYVPGTPENNGSGAIQSFRRQYVGIPLLGKLHFSRDLSHRLLDQNMGIDLIHSHGLWRMPNIYAARAAKRRGVPHVISPRGMLSRVALEFSKYRKQLFWSAEQKSAIEQAACLHATAASEYHEIRKLGIRCPIAIVSNGIDLPDFRVHAPHGPASGAKRQKTLLYVGRIHPKKGLDALVGAWATVAKEFADWRVRIVGPGEEVHRQVLLKQIARLNVPRIFLDAPVYGHEKWALFGGADLFVLPSNNENFGLAVAESLACRRPVIVTKGAPWQGVETHGCGWWIDTGELAMVDALRTALGTPADVFAAMGARGELWMRQEFSWDSIGEEVSKVYLWLCGRAARPVSVRID